MSNSNIYRQAIQVVTAKPFSHGQGFQAYSVGQQSLGTEIAPFLQLDHYFMTQPTFAEHPHQGFSAVTYMFEDSAGSFFNEDSQGDRSTIAPGDLHWTQAGSGIRHNETPIASLAPMAIEPGKICHGIQMFVDLPLVDKSLPAQAFHLAADQIPIYTTPEGGRVRVVVGNAHGLTSPLKISTKIRFLDVILPANSSIEHEVAPTESVFLLAVKGSGLVGETQDAIETNQATLFTSTGNIIKTQAGANGIQYVLCISQ
jgi:redox-sensitive bicupin YhaK (pirin superfamily)